MEIKKTPLFLILVLLVSLGLNTCKAFYGPAGEGQRQGKPGAGSTSAVTALAPNDATLSGSLALWLDASDSLYTDSGCSTQVSVDGNMVVCWKDKSGNGKDAIYSGSTVPTYSSGGINGHPVIYFNGGTNCFLNNSDFTFNYTSTSTGGITIITVSKNNASLTASIFSIGNGIDIISQFFDSSSEFGYSISRNAEDGFSTPFMPSGNSVGNAVIFTTTSYDNYDPMNQLQTPWSVINMYKNGVLFSTGGSKATAFTFSQYFIGTDYYKSYFLNGYLGQIIVYNRVLTAAERQGVEKYLSNKYNIPIAQ